MVNKIKCEICGKEITNNNSYIGSHVKRVHKINLIDYVKKYYIHVNQFQIQKCGFCSNDAIPNFLINHFNKEYEMNYDNGFFCETFECKNNISKNIFGTNYDKKTFEHIGSNSEYLSKLYKINIPVAKEMKFNKNRNYSDDKYKTNLNGYIRRYGEIEGTIKYKERCDKLRKNSKLKKYNFKCSLNGYINKYGEIIGTKKYKERCQKIGLTNSKQWYISKYGEKEGNERWEKYTTKIKKSLHKKQSNSSKKISILLEDLNIKYLSEFHIKEINKFCDFYLPNTNTIIEFYGDYWHCNPLIYKKDFYHQFEKKTAFEIWQSDKKRIDSIYNHFNNEISIIIIWENSKINADFLFKIINDNKNEIMYI